MEALAEKKGCTSGQLAIAWLLHKSPNVIPLFGTKSIKNIDANTGGATISLTPEEFAAIDSSFSPSEVSWQIHGLLRLEILDAYAAGSKHGSHHTVAITLKIMYHHLHTKWPQR